MKKTLLVLLLLSIYHIQAQTPKRELRGAWVATYFGIDWPNRNQTPQQQRDAFISIVNQHKQTGITTMFVQVRSQSDAMYPSSIEPWGFYLTPVKADGNAPNPAWDPMQFMIDECHARGMEFHAWINPFRAIGNIANLPNFAPNHVARQHPEWLIANGAERIMDPGLPDVRNHINSVVMDIVSRYDVDGIHFDDYFYPNAAFNDDATFAAYNRGFTIRADWRRDNINLLIQSVSINIKAAKPWVEFGVSPSGIWRNGGTEGSATTGLQHYVSLYADSRKWLQQGWVDYLCPQVYWYINQTGSDYKVLIPWWNNNAFGRLIYIGMAGYKVNDPAMGAPWLDRSQVPNQVRMNRNAVYPNIKGQSIYNTTSLRNNGLNFRDSLRVLFYNKPALQPLMPWIDAVPPAPASGLTASYDINGVTLNWENPPAAAGEMDKVKQLVIYRSENPVVDASDVNNMVAITPVTVTTFTDTTTIPDKTYYYKITTLDRLHNESEATAAVAVCTFDDTEAPVITSCPPASSFCFNAEENYPIPVIAATDNCVNLAYSFTITGATGRNGTGTNASGHFERGVSTIHWTVSDGAGNASTCETIVAIHNNPVITVPDTWALPSGTLANTVYIGYAPASSITLTATSSNGTAPYSYIWSTDAAGASIIVSPLVPTGYSVGVVDANGCDGLADVFVNVIDVRAGKKKVKICHKPWHQNSSLEVGSSAVASHLAHGDMLGSCVACDELITAIQPSVSEKSSGGLLMTASPNPSSSYFIIRINAAEAGTISLRVRDILGRVVETKENISPNQSIQIGEKYRQGVYIIELIQGNSRQVLKLIKL